MSHTFSEIVRQLGAILSEDPVCGGVAEISAPSRQLNAFAPAAQAGEVRLRIRFTVAARAGMEAMGSKPKHHLKSEEQLSVSARVSNRNNHFKRPLLRPSPRCG